MSLALQNPGFLTEFDVSPTVPYSVGQVWAMALVAQLSGKHCAVFKELLRFLDMTAQFWWARNTSSQGNTSPFNLNPLIPCLGRLLKRFLGARHVGKEGDRYWLYRKRYHFCQGSEVMGLQTSWFIESWKASWMTGPCYHLFSAQKGSYSCLQLHCCFFCFVFSWLPKCPPASFLYLKPGLIRAHLAKSLGF